MVWIAYLRSSSTGCSGIYVFVGLIHANIVLFNGALNLANMVILNGVTGVADHTFLDDIFFMKNYVFFLKAVGCMLDCFET